MCVCGRQTDRQRQRQTESKGNVRVGVEWGVPRICVCVRQTDRDRDRKRAKGT